MDKGKIESILKDQGRSKKWLHEQLGISRTTLYLIFEGKIKSKTEQSIKVAELLEVNINDVI